MPGFFKYTPQTWIVFFVWIVCLQVLHGLVTTTLNVCGDQNNLLVCPSDTVIIIKSVVVLDGTTCLDTTDCPRDTSLTSTLVKDCFGKQICDMNTTTTICSFHDGSLAVEAACIKDENVISNCSDQGKQLSSNSGPFMVVTPGYPKLYNISEQCSNMINLDSGLINGHIAIVDRYSPAINSYLCGTAEQIDVHIQSGLRQCNRIHSMETFPNARTFTFTFSPYPGDTTGIRGILFEVTADNVTQNDSIVPVLLRELPQQGPETNTTSGEGADSFFTPLVIVGVTAGGAVLLLIFAVLGGASCRGCCKSSSHKGEKLRKSNHKKKKEGKTRFNTAVGAEAFFAGAKVDPPYSNNSDIVEDKGRSRQQRDPERPKDESHVYQNSRNAQSMTVIADVHRERTKPRGRRKPMKTPRKSKPPSAHLGPIYENQRLENNEGPVSNGEAGYDNAGYVNTG